MGRYLLIDHEEKSVELLKESIKFIDPQAQFEDFVDFKTFETHVKTLLPEKIEPFWQFDLIIADHDLLPHSKWAEQITLFKTLNKKTAPLVLTGYENAHTTLHFIRPLDIYNFIFKPFDSLILKESLHFALKIGKKAQPIEIKAQTATAFVAILKEVELQSISELGFVTMSESQLGIGSVTKFFSPLFLNGKKQSVWAQCLISIAHPQKPGLFINKFQFYCTDQNFLNHIRKHIQKHKQDQTSNALWNFNPPKTIAPIKIALIALENEESKTFAEDLQKRYTNLTVELIKLDPQKKSAAEVLDFNYAINLTDIKFDQLKDFFKKETVFFWMTNPFTQEDEIKEHALNYRDLFLRPLDRSYFFKKIKTHITGLNEVEPSFVTNIATHEKMKAAQKVKISEISELYVNIVYGRELPFKEFREFVFLSDDETQVIELPAFCHFTEKAANDASGGADKTTYFTHQFVFFAMTDHFLKQIRLWLLHNYILQNQNKD